MLLNYIFFYVLFFFIIIRTFVTMKIDVSNEVIQY